MWISLLAHAGGCVPSFRSGCIHPILGLNRLLAMVTVGLLSARVPVRQMGVLPAAFVVFMAAGGLLGLVWAPGDRAAVE